MSVGGLLAPLGVGVGVYWLLLRASAVAAATERPVTQALARLLTLLPAYLHELAHASTSILFTGRGRVRLHSVRTGSSRADGQVALGSSDVWFRGPLTNAVVSAAPALLLWPLAAWLAWHVVGGGAGVGAAGAIGVLTFAGRLSDSDLDHLRRVRHPRHARR
ncbi:MAG: hypothetical protein ABI696_16035 [Rubrivivax sp.]